MHIYNCIATARHKISQPTTVCRVACSVRIVPYIISVRCRRRSTLNQPITAEGNLRSACFVESHFFTPQVFTRCYGMPYNVMPHRAALRVFRPNVLQYGGKRQGAVENSLKPGSSEKGHFQFFSVCVVCNFACVLSANVPEIEE